MGSSVSKEGAHWGTLDSPMLGTVAIVGFPNVGKSTLVNRLTGTRAAVVHEQPGVTRDRKELICEWRDKRFRLIDTGGVDIADATPITRSIAADGSLALLDQSGATAALPSGSHPLDEAVSGNGRFLYVLVDGRHTIAGYRIAEDGSLGPLGEVGTLPAGAVGLASS